MNLPITAKAQYSTQKGLITTRPIIGGYCDCTMIAIAILHQN
jgi:hypothetical protein